jgi:hypothetical protein
MRSLLDLTGQRFGKLTVLAEVPRTNRRERRWQCRCDCGKEQSLNQRSLRTDRVRSCGCLTREALAKSHEKHGHASGYRQTRAYSAWAAMLQRCRNPKNPRYSQYGGRGISVCEEWLQFEPFLTDLGEPPEGHSLDRIDNDGNYEPSNVRWSDRISQQNNRRCNHLLTYDGITDTVTGWSRRAGLTAHVIRKRLRLGWSVEDTLTKPVTPGYARG